MVEFSKWESLWNAYNRGGRPVPGSIADTCWDAGAAFIWICFALFVISFVMFAAGGSEERCLRPVRIGAVGCGLGLILWFASALAPSHIAHVAEPPALDAQIVRTWGLDDLDGCGKTSMKPLERLVGDGLPDSGLRDGDWKCVAYRDGRRFDVTVHINGHRVGLYTTDGKALKTEGKQ